MLQELKENKRFIAFFVIFVLAFWSVSIFSTVKHESAHRKICRNFGGENITTYTNYTSGFMSGETLCSGMPTEEETKPHAQAEVVGYHTTALVYAFFIGIFMLIAYWELRRD